MTANAAANKVQIRRLVNDWAKAVRAKDIDGALSHHARDMVMFDVPFPLQSRGIKAYRKTWELFFENVAGGGGVLQPGPIAGHRRRDGRVLPRALENWRREEPNGSADDWTKENSREVAYHP